MQIQLEQFYHTVERQNMAEGLGIFEIFHFMLSISCQAFPLTSHHGAAAADDRQSED